MAPNPTAWYAAKPVGAGAGPVTQDLLVKSPSDPSQWLLYGGGYNGFRHSPVTSLTPDSVKGLHVAWSAPTGVTAQFETSPVVYDGVMYITTAYNRLLALDARTGEFLWRYDHTLPTDFKSCCGPVNRGVAIAGDLVIMGTLDTHLMAFDRKTGKVAWDHEIADNNLGYTITSAPLVVGSLIYTGVSGGEFGAPGFVGAYDLETGKQVWQRFTVPRAASEPAAKSWAGDSWKSGGAPTWTTGAYDTETDTLFWTVGNPSPDWNGDNRAGDNLYSDSVLALDPKTGKMKWYFQFTPHDVWDYDGNTHVFLIDTMIGGKPVKVIAQPNRNGFFYELDRTTGKFLRATQYVEQLSWAKGVDAAGRPIVDPDAMPQENATARVCPSNMGGINGAWTAAYDPKTALVFTPSIETCDTYTKGIAVHVDGLPFMGGLPTPLDGPGKAYGLVSAIDVKTGKVTWRYRDPRPMMAGVVSTAGGVLFTSNLEGEALALDQATGEKLWSFRMGGGGRGQPIVYELDGKPYVAVPSGSWATVDTFAGAGTMIPEGGQLFVFSLDK